MEPKVTFLNVLFVKNQNIKFNLIHDKEKHHMLDNEEITWWNSFFTHNTSSEFLMYWTFIKTTQPRTS